jgi:hypothetical protein
MVGLLLLAIRFNGIKEQEEQCHYVMLATPEELNWLLQDVHKEQNIASKWQQST